MIPVKETMPSSEAEALERRLRRKIDGEVRYDNGSRALNASDLSVYLQEPIGLVILRSY
jgi:hypothetical protein